MAQQVAIAAPVAVCHLLVFKAGVSSCVKAGLLDGIAKIRKFEAVGFINKPSQLKEAVGAVFILAARFWLASKGGYVFIV